MFTGIVAGTVPILRIIEGEGVRSFTVDLGSFVEGLEVGASVSLDGVCMTVVNIDSGKVTFDAITDPGEDNSGREGGGRPSECRKVDEGWR